MVQYLHQLVLVYPLVSDVADVSLLGCDKSVELLDLFEGLFVNCGFVGVDLDLHFVLLLE